METDMQRDGGRYEIGLVADEIEDVLVQCSSFSIGKRIEDVSGTEIDLNECCPVRLQVVGLEICRKGFLSCFFVGVLVHVMALCSQRAVQRFIFLSLQRHTAYNRVCND